MHFALVLDMVGVGFTPVNALELYTISDDQSNLRTVSRRQTSPDATRHRVSSESIIFIFPSRDQHKTQVNGIRLLSHFIPFLLLSGGSIWCIVPAAESQP
ncbi:hypothetical protein PoB_002379100 [Plakobranchus ocellatus]|uniref:Secreted protein n=1 Tax=Plakobranchus ocellatus TaxID=259542 RepID=A0AAV3ZS15_9GAST|nr:hypothetical protein PoB_002379100 [Plakobranchus ocellatus]